MPGEYVPGLSTYPCISYPDGSVGYCSSIEYMKVGQFAVEGDTQGPPGWRAEDGERIHIPFERLASVLAEYGIKLEYDEDDLRRRLFGSGQPS